MAARLLIALAIALPVVSGSSAWTDFVNYKAPVVAPEGGIAGLNLASQRRTGSGVSFVIQPQTTGDSARYVLPNAATTGSAATSADLKMRVFELCYNARAGTSFEGTVKAAWESSAGATSNETRAASMPPQCAQCLAMGWGVDNHNGFSGTSDPTPGFYLPCGCQSTCVDVSGGSKASFSKIPTSASFLASGTSFSATGSTYQKLASWTTGTPFPLGGNTGSDGYQSLTSCQDYLDNGLVYSCSQIAEYQTMVWVSVLMGIVFVYVAISMSGMQLDMDSLLYTVGSSGGKKDQ